MRQKQNPMCNRIRAIAVMVYCALWGWQGDLTAQQLDWTQQWGTAGIEDCHDMVIDDTGSLYVCGETNGDLNGTNSGTIDGYVRKYDRDGNLLWSRLIGTPQSDRATRVLLDDGFLYVAGESNGNFAGIPAISNDVFLSKYDLSGNLIWERHVLPTGFTTASYEFLDGLTADELGDIYIAGTTNGVFESGNTPDNWDCFIVKYEKTGDRVWSRQFGSDGDEDCNAIAADARGNIFIVGGSYGDLDTPNTDLGTELDAFIAKYEVDGTFRWIRRDGVPGRDRYESVVTDGIGNAYVCGGTSDVLGLQHFGSEDVVVARYGSNYGPPAWLNQQGSPGNEVAYDLKLDDSGDIFISGRSQGDFGSTNAGIGFTSDVFVGRLSRNGGWRYWNRLYGTPFNDEGTAVESNGMGKIYVAGRTHGSLGGPNFGDQDGFLAQVSVIPNKLFVDDFEVVLGDLFSGGKSQFHESDNDKLKIRRATSPIELRFTTVIPLQIPSRLEFTFEASVRSSRAVTQSIEMFNIEDEAWELVDTRNARVLGDGIASVVIDQNIQRFVDPDFRTIQTRVRFSKTGLSRGIQAFIDAACWTIEGN